MKKFLFLKDISFIGMLVMGLILGFVAGWISLPTRKAELKNEMAKKATVLVKKAEVVKELEGCKTARDGQSAKLSTCVGKRDQYVADYEERGKLLAEKGMEMSMLYDSLGEVMEASSEQAEELLCAQRGGTFDAAVGTCKCDGTWEGAICVNAEMEARQQLCEAGGGAWEDKKCHCGSGMMFSPEKGCVERPYPPSAQEVIAGLEKKVRELREKRNFYEDSFSTCKAALKKPPKLTVQGAKIVSCTPGACAP